MMIERYKEFLEMGTEIRKNFFQEASENFDTKEEYIEKDFWVCLALGLLFNHLPEDHPSLFFKGGTSLSKAFSLINRFSEDVDIVVDRTHFGFSDDEGLVAEFRCISRKKREEKLEEITKSCSRYMLSELKPILQKFLDEITPECCVSCDTEDKLKQSLLLRYPSVFGNDGKIKIEGGARSAVTPWEERVIEPYLSNVFKGSKMEVPKIKTVSSQRTYWDKLLKIHGISCRYRDEGKKPSDNSRVARDYYDLAKLSENDKEWKFLQDTDFLNKVREHCCFTFQEKWRKYDEAKPGTFNLYPQDDLISFLKEDYKKMQSMIFKDPPSFDNILQQISNVEDFVNSEEMVKSYQMKHSKPPLSPIRVYENTGR